MSSLDGDGARDEFRYYAIALYDYDPREPDQLHFSAGNILAIINDESVSSTGWLGAANLDTGGTGWASKSFLHPLDGDADADAYIRNRSVSVGEDVESVSETLASLSASFAARALLNSVTITSDAASIITTGDNQSLSFSTARLRTSSIVDDGKSIQSVATYGSVYPRSMKAPPPSAVLPESATFGGVEVFLQRQRFFADPESASSKSGSGSGGSGSSDSTIIPGHPTTNSHPLRNVKSVAGLSFGASSSRDSFFANANDDTSPSLWNYQDPSSSTNLTLTCTLRLSPLSLYESHN